MKWEAAASASGFLRNDDGTPLVVSAIRARTMQELRLVTIRALSDRGHHGFIMGSSFVPP